MPDRVTRKGNRDVDPDEMRRRYDAGEQGAGSTSMAEEFAAESEESHRKGFAEGARAQRQAGSTRTIALQRPGGFPAIAAPLAVELVLITADEIINEHRLPLPSRLLVAFGVFGVLGLATGDAAPAASVFAWGLVVASFYSSSVKGKQPAGLTALQAVGNFMSGKYGAGLPAKGKVA